MHKFRNDFSNNFGDNVNETAKILLRFEEPSARLRKIVLIIFGNSYLFEIISQLEYKYALILIM